MMRKKILAVSVLAAIITALLVGCALSMSYTFSVATGDNIVVKLDSKDGYKLEQDEGHAYVYTDAGVQALDLYFLTREMYDEVKGYISASPEGAETEALTAGNGQAYDRVCYDGDDGDTYVTYMFWIEGSETGVMIDSTLSVEDAQAAFDLLSVKKAT